MSIKDLSDFDYLPKYEDLELFDVQKHVDSIIDDIQKTVELITKDMKSPIPFKVEASVYRWTPCYDDEYELGAELKFEYSLENDEYDEKLLHTFESDIENNELFKNLERKYGKIDVFAYIPFELLK